MILASLILLSLTAAVSPWVSRWLGRAAGPLLAAVPAVVFLTLLNRLGAVTGEGGGPISTSLAWIPSLGIDLSFRLDGLSLLFALLITGIGSLVVLYASEYLREHPLRHRFYAFLLAFMVSMLGVVTADDVILLFAFWELTSITSYLLIGFDHDKRDSRRSATQALLVTGLGGLALLAGLLLLGIAAGDVAGVPGGVWTLSEILSIDGIAAGLASHPLFPGLVACVLLGALTKSAQFPFHFWLPNAMAAPTPVSAYLHSSTMVKAGVYLVMRLNPALEGGAGWSWALLGFGGATMLVGAVLACRETQFKKVLAYSTVSSLGIMVLFTGVGGEYGALAAGGYLLAHALFKACLFLVAGSVTHGTGSKDIEALGGLRRAMPLTAAAGLIGGLSMAGTPPLMGFVGKELLLKASTHPPEASVAHGYAAALTAAVFVAAVLTVIVSVLVGWRPFFAASTRDEPLRGHEPGWRMQAGPGVLAALTVVLAFTPGLFPKPVLGATIASITGHAPEASHVKVAVWDLLFPFAGFSAAFALSLAALGAGVVLYRLRGAWRPALRGALAAADPVSPARAYGGVLAGSVLLARWLTGTVQSGKLNLYVAWVVLTTTALVIWGLVRSGDPVTGFEQAGLTFLDASLITLIVLGAAACTWYRSRLAAIAALGMVGYAVAVVFVVLGVPDIAMTQFSIETLTVIIFVLVIYQLPRFNVYSGVGRRMVDAAIAMGFGGSVTLLVLVARGNGAGLTPISETLGEWSLTRAFGRNVVNVILVDFRGMDTMGEITVLGIAAIGVYTLLRLRPRAGRGEAGPAGPRLSPASVGGVPAWREAEQ